MITTKLLLLFSLTFLLTSCSLVSPASQPTTPTAISPPPASGEESEVRNVVERFGKKLQMVSLQSPNAREEIREQYSEFVSSELLERWVHDPSLASGRIVSSPWPDRIEIASITKKEPGQYIANGFVVEVTSMEVVSGGAANKVPVQITLQNMQGRWVITEYTQQ